jgi:transposase
MYKVDPNKVYPAREFFNIRIGAMKIGFLGVDVSKLTLDVALIIDEKVKCKEFSNKQEGFVALETWIERQGVSDLRACMEATGTYSLALATYLHEAGQKVSVVNPAKIKGFAQCELARVKTDKADARLIARYCQRMTPEPWKPKPKHIREMQEWVHRAEALQGMMQQERNRRQTVSNEIAERVDATITYLNKEIAFAKGEVKRIIKSHPDLLKKQQLLNSIPGVSDATIGRVLSCIDEVHDFDSAKEVSAFVGLNPRHYQSGTSVKGRARISKTGDSKLRKSFYMPALVAMKHNPTVREFCENLSKRGKPKMVVLVAAMRKLLHIIYGVLKNEKPYDPNWNQRIPVLDIRA